MGTKNNVSPNHFKEDGRERPSQNIDHELNKQRFAQAEANQRLRNKDGGSEFIPGENKKQETIDTPVKERKNGGR